MKLIAIRLASKTPFIDINNKTTQQNRTAGSDLKRINTQITSYLIQPSDVMPLIADELSLEVNKPYV